MASPNRILLLVGFLDMMSVSFILPYLDIHAKKLDFNHIQIGIVRAVFSGCQIISSPIVGSLSDIRGRKPILLLCLIICSFAYFWLGITSSLLVFLGLRAVLGTFEHTQILTRVWAPDYVDDANQVTVFYGKLISLGAFGSFLGPILSGYVMEAYSENGFTIICAILSAFFVLNAGLISSLPETLNEKKEAVLKTTQLYDPTADMLNQTVDKFCNVDWTVCWEIFTYQLLLSIPMGLYFNNFHLFLKTEHDMSPVYLGYIIAIEGIVSSITNNTVSYVNKIYVYDRNYSQRILHIFLVIVLSLIGLAVVPSITLYVVLLIPKAVSFALARVVSLSVVTNRSTSSNRGTLIGAFNSVSLVGSDIATPIIGGIIIHFFGVTYVFFTGAMFASIGLVLSYRARSRSKKEKTK